MKKVNVASVEKEPWQSPKGTFAGEYQGITLALGADPRSTDLRKRLPFDVEITTLPPGAKNFPYHAHAAQTEFYLVISGAGLARDEAGEHPIGPGDAFFYHPGEAHQIINPGPDPLVFYVVADNPPADPCYYPDSDKWAVRVGNRRLCGRITEAAYEDGEE